MTTPVANDPLGVTLAEILSAEKRKKLGRESASHRVNSDQLAAAVEGEPAMPWSVVENGGDCGGDTPWAVVKDDDGAVEGCHATEAEAQQQVEALYANEGDGDGQGGEFAAEVPVDGTEAPVTGAPVDEATNLNGLSSNTLPWAGVLAVEGTPTGDGRQFSTGALTWGELPIPLRWQKEDTHGGTLVNGVVTVGRIDAVERIGAEIHGRGVIDLENPDGLEVARRMGTQAAPGFLSGVSIDADDPDHSDVEFIMAPGCDGEADLDSATPEEAMACMTPEMTIYHGGRIRAATLVDIPAFVEARLFLTAALDADCGCDVEITEAITAAAHSITFNVPDRSWFSEPTGQPEIGAITVTDDGRIFGYLAPRNVPHRGYTDRRITVPMRNVDYTRWMNRPTIVEGGERIAAGPITMGCGHASTRPGVGSDAALDHYDNSCSVVATARIGENRHGVWIAGALLPGIQPEQIARMLSCQLSGDWRPHREQPGKREFCGALLVPVPGFPVAHREMRVRVDAGQLVASAVPMVHRNAAETAETNPGLALAAKLVAKSVGRDKTTRLRELRSKIKG